MSASMMVLDLIRAHYRYDEQAFRTFAFRLARLSRTEDMRKTMVDVIERGGRHARDFAPAAPSRFAPPTVLAPPKPKAPTSDMLEPIADVTLDDLLLGEDLRAQLDEVVLEIAYRSELEARNLTPQCRLLFEGPPGNGKTSSGAAIAHELGCQAYAVSIPSLVSKWLGETGQNVASLFADIDSGSIVVFDEIDAIGGARTQADSSAAKEHNSTVNTMLTMLDRKTGGTLIATTNRADILDPALLRRFDEIVTFPAPSREQMTMLARRLEDKFKLTAPVDLTGCENFDAVTKRVTREARRAAMTEILALKAAQSEELNEEEEENDGKEREQEERPGI